MKLIVTFLWIFLPFVAFSQTIDSMNIKSSNLTDSVTFIAKIDKSHETIDGIYVNGYVVNIEHSQIIKLDGRKVRISGRITIEKGLKSLPKKHDSDGNPIIYHGREIDTRHIDKPKIEIIE